MAKWNVYGYAQITVTMTVDADSLEEALDLAQEEFPGLSNYAGNGGTDKLVGVDDPRVSLDADSSGVTFEHAECEDDE